jgi:hypothetical protein
MIELACPCCASALQVPDHRADTAIRCPECEEPLRVPSAGLRPAGAPVAAGPPAQRGGLLAGALVALLAAVPVAGALAFFGPAGSARTAGSAGVPAVPLTVRSVAVPAPPAAGCDDASCGPVAGDSPAVQELPEEGDDLLGP